MSDEAEAQPLYADDGTQAGWTVEAEDGAIVALDMSGTEIVGAMDPGTGELIDHTDYELPQPDYEYDDPRVAELYEAQAQLEQRLAAQENQEPPFAYIPPPDPDGEEEVESWRRDLVDIEANFGRSLTDDEKRRLAIHAHENGQSLIEAGEDLASRGHGIVDIDQGGEHARRAARAQLMAEHLQDAVDPADVDGIRAATRQSYDLDDREQRQAYMADRLEGRDLTDAAVYNGTDSYPTSEEENWYGDLD